MNVIVSWGTLPKNFWQEFFTILKTSEKWGATGCSPGSVLFHIKEWTWYFVDDSKRWLILQKTDSDFKMSLTDNMSINRDNVLPHSSLEKSRSINMKWLYPAWQNILRRRRPWTGKESSMGAGKTNKILDCFKINTVSRTMEIMLTLYSVLHSAQVLCSVWALMVEKAIDKLKCVLRTTHVIKGLKTN